MTSTIFLSNSRSLERNGLIIGTLEYIVIDHFYWVIILKSLHSFFYLIIIYYQIRKHKGGLIWEGYIFNLVSSSKKFAKSHCSSTFQHEMISMFFSGWDQHVLRLSHIYKCFFLNDIFPPFINSDLRPNVSQFEKNGNDESKSDARWDEHNAKLLIYCTCRCCYGRNI